MVGQVDGGLGDAAQIGQGPGQADYAVEAAGGDAAGGVEIFEELVAGGVEGIVTAQDRAGDLAVEDPGGVAVSMRLAIAGRRDPG